MLVGATLVFGIGNNEAHASEKTSTEESTQSNEDTASQDSVKQKGDVQTNEQATNNNVNPEQVDVTNEANTSEESTTEETPKAETTKEAPTTAEEPKAETTKEAPATAEEPKAETTKEAPATAEEPKAETTKEAPATAEEPKADTTKEKTTTKEEPTTAEEPTTKTTSEQTPESKQIDSKRTTSEQASQPVAQSQNSAQSTKTQDVNTVVNNVKKAKTTEDKQEALTNYIADTNNTSQKEAKAQVENLDLDYNHLNETTLLSALAQDYSNKKDSTTTYATPRSTTSAPKPVNRLGVKKLAAVRQGTNVNDKVHFSNIDIAIDRGHTNPQTGQKEFWATSSDVLKLKSDYTIDDDVHEGDQMTFQYGKYFRPGSVSLPSTQQNLYDANGGLVAKGIYDSNTNSTTYTFITTLINIIILKVVLNRLRLLNVKMQPLTKQLIQCKSL
ncbi:Ig-like domain-containing protein [Staphylococcus warneri]|uniref:Ig-like domain-containing protein n=1 Tax=Staphylococcus warneri TaxID=1292 RepID=UPI0039E696B2